MSKLDVGDSDAEPFLLGPGVMDLIGFDSSTVCLPGPRRSCERRQKTAASHETDSLLVQHCFSRKYLRCASTWEMPQGWTTCREQRALPIDKQSANGQHRVRPGTGEAHQSSQATESCTVGIHDIEEKFNRVWYLIV